MFFYAILGLFLIIFFYLIPEYSLVDLTVVCFFCYIFRLLKSSFLSFDKNILKICLFLSFLFFVLMKRPILRIFHGFLYCLLLEIFPFYSRLCIRKESIIKGIIVVQILLSCVNTLILFLSFNSFLANFVVYYRFVT